MSEQVIEHPIAVIDNLLKMGKGDKGRLLYLKKALINGKTIYESDKKYLKQMQKNYSENKSFTDTHDLFKDKKEKNLKQNKNLKSKSSKLNKIPATGYGENNINNSDHEIQSIQTLIVDIRTTDSQIKDNLELLLANREIYSNNLTDGSSFVVHPSSGNSSSSDFLSSGNPYRSKQFSFLGLKKHDLMAFASAGLFLLWVASYMNLINLGPMKGLTFGLSAGSAVAAALFLKKNKNKQLMKVI